MEYFYEFFRGGGGFFIPFSVSIFSIDFVSPHFFDGLKRRGGYGSSNNMDVRVSIFLFCK